MCALILIIIIPESKQKKICRTFFILWVSLHTNINGNEKTKCKNKNTLKLDYTTTTTTK